MCTGIISFQQSREFLRLLSQNLGGHQNTKEEILKYHSTRTGAKPPVKAN